MSIYMLTNLEALSNAWPMYSPKHTTAAITIPPTRIKNTPATLSICSSLVSSVEVLPGSGQFLDPQYLQDRKSESPISI